MNMFLFFIVLGLIGGGVAMLLLSLLPVRGIIRQLPDSTLRSRWRTLAALIFIFICGYLLYAIQHGPETITTLSSLVVPGIFCCGALFVYLVCSLSLKTTDDLRQMYILQEETITDPLTGMYNRRYLERRIVEEFQRAMRFEQPFAVFLLDIDHFKLVNDTYGHQVGDVVLRKLGHLIMDSVREVDVVIRYGGEEILVILPNTVEKNALELAERLREQIEKTEMAAAKPMKSQPAIFITISIGVSEYQFADGWDNARSVLERADQALYRAKERGRNCVIASQRCDEGL